MDVATAKIFVDTWYHGPVPWTVKQNGWSTFSVEFKRVSPAEEVHLDVCFIYLEPIDTVSERQGISKRAFVSGTAPRDTAEPVTVLKGSPRHSRSAARFLPGAKPGAKTVEVTPNLDSSNQTGERKGEMKRRRYASHRGKDRNGALRLKVIALQPNIAAWKRGTPVFLRVASASTERDASGGASFLFNMSEFECSFELVIKAQHTVAALHPGEPAERAHDARCHYCDRPTLWFRERDLASNAVSRPCFVSAGLGGREGRSAIPLTELEGPIHS